MINKEKVLKVIDDFIVAQEKQSQKSDSNNVKDELQYCKEKKELLEYLKGLDRDELIDLCALNDYGMDAVHNGRYCNNFNEYTEFRKGVCYTEVLASDFIKITNLNSYLQKSLELYDTVKANF